MAVCYQRVHGDVDGNAQPGRKMLAHPWLCTWLWTDAQVKNNKRYKGAGKFTMAETAAAVGQDFGKIDVLVHSLANGPEVTKPLLETSRAVLLPPPPPPPGRRGVLCCSTSPANALKADCFCGIAIISMYCNLQ